MKPQGEWNFYYSINCSSGDLGFLMKSMKHWIICRLKIKEDYISKLPYEVLAQILSIYPLDSGSKAVAIFTGLWNRPCIQHKGRTVKLQDFESIISSFLVNFDENNPLKKPRKLEFHFDRGSIVTASIGLNKKLNLDFSKGKQEFPRQFGWEIVLNTLDFAQPSPYPFSVKTLRLTSVNYLSCELVSSLINKFRYVETLIIDKCNGLRSLKVEGLAKLTNLIVRDCVDLKSVFIQTLELKTLRYGGPLCWFSLKNVMYLEDVMLDFECPGFIHLNHHLYNPLLRAIRDVKVLTFHGWMFKVSLYWLVSSWIVFDSSVSCRTYLDHCCFRSKTRNISDSANLKICGGLILVWKIITSIGCFVSWSSALLSRGCS